MNEEIKDTHKLCTAPMLDWSDRHCRFLFRLFAPRAMLYTEMITTGAIIYGNQNRHLDFSCEVRYWSGREPWRRRPRGEEVAW